MKTIRQQIHNNAVALVSIFIAVSALAYNKCRHETTEEQRNIRHAAFRVLEDLGEVQEIESPCAMSITRQRLKKLAYMANSGGIANIMVSDKWGIGSWSNHPSTDALPA